MTGPLPERTRIIAVRLLMTGWEPKAIAKEVHCYYTTVYRLQATI